MGVKEYWLIEDTLMPTYGHLVDIYSEKVKNEWKVKVEDFSCEEFEGTEEVKEEHEDDSSISLTVDETSSKHSHMVIWGSTHACLNVMLLNFPLSLQAKFGQSKGIY